MKTIHAIFENGVFRPTEPVDLPETCEVVFEPRMAHAETTEAKADASHLDPKLANIYGLLSHQFDGGQLDAAARHNEHCGFRS